MKRSLSYYVGTGLVFLSVSIFVFIFYPLVSVFLFPVSLTDIKKSEYTLIIPKINAVGRVIEDIDPWHEASYKEVLKKGIGQASGFAHPDQKGTVFLFAHSSGAPWELTHYNTVFLRLTELKIGDRMEIWYKSKEYHYKVTKIMEVYPTEINAVKKEKEADLIVQTCTPLGTDWKRLLVFAKKVEVKE